MKTHHITYLAIGLLFAIGQKSAQAGCWISYYNENNQPVYDCTKPEQATSVMQQQNIVLEEPVNDYYREQIAQGRIISPEDNTKYSTLGQYIPEGHVHQEAAPEPPPVTVDGYVDKIVEAEQLYKDELNLWRNMNEPTEKQLSDQEAARQTLAQVRQGYRRNEERWKEYDTAQQHWENQQNAEREWRTPRSNLEVSAGYYDTYNPSDRERVMDPDAYMRFKGDDLLIHPDGHFYGAIQEIKRSPEYVREAAAEVYERVSR